MSDYQHDQLRHHEYDGIQEYDNKLPNWWLWILYGSVVFSFGYWLVFHTLEVGDLPVERYHREVAAAEAARRERMAEEGPTNESLRRLARQPERVAEGEKLFGQYCVVCHLEKGQGSVGPNLTDRYWIHGGEPVDIYDTIFDGVPDKGMAAWGGQLGPNRVESLTAYVLTLRNTEVEGKAPEGELYRGGEAGDKTAGSESAGSESAGDETAAGQKSPAAAGEAADGAAPAETTPAEAEAGSGTAERGADE